jgi:hypothetical protein
MTLLAALLTGLLGGLVIGPWVAGGGLVSLWALGFAAGAGLLSLQLLAYSLAGVPWNLWLILLPWAALGAWRLRRRPAMARPEWPSWTEWIALAAGLAAPLLWFGYERVMPLNTRDWDAWAIWLFKAKAFYLDGGVKGFLARAGEFQAQPSYPLLVPLYGAFLFIVAGGAADPAAKALSPCFFFALLGAFYYLARRLGSREVAAVFTAMLAGLHMVDIVAFELAGYADTTLSLYLLLGAGFVYAWWKTQQWTDLALASGFSALAGWTKNEGLFFLAAVGALVVIRLARERTRDWRPWAAVAAPPLMAVVPWVVLRAHYRVPASDLLDAGHWNWGNLVPGVMATIRQAFRPAVYNLTFWLLAASPGAARQGAVGASWWILPGLVLWQMAGLVGAYLTGRNDLQWWIGTSLDRILAQVAPLALLASAVAVAAWTARWPQPAPAARQGRRDRKAKASKGK